MANVVKHKEKHHFQRLNVIFPSRQRGPGLCRRLHPGPPPGLPKSSKNVVFFHKGFGEHFVRQNAPKWLPKLSQNLSFWRLLGVQGLSINFWAFLYQIWLLSERPEPSIRMRRASVCSRLAVFERSLFLVISILCSILAPFWRQKRSKMTQKVIQKTARFLTPF